MGDKKKKFTGFKPTHHLEDAYKPGHPLWEAENHTFERPDLMTPEQRDKFLKLWMEAKPTFTEFLNKTMIPIMYGTKGETK